MEQKTTSSAKLSEPCECQLLRVTLPVPVEDIFLVIISVHFGKSRNPYARPDASPPQGRGRGQPHPLSPLILLCPTMMILVMRRLLYTARHQHRQILDAMKSSLILDFTLKISEWYNYSTAFRHVFGHVCVKGGAGGLAAHDLQRAMR